MENFKDEGKAVGLLFDISIRHEKNGKRIIDNLKKVFVSIIQNYIEDNFDEFYLYHPELVDSVTSRGDQICAVGNYQTDGWLFNLNNAFRRTIYVLMAQELTYKKYLFYFTDRILTTKNIELALRIDKSNMVDVHFILIGIGNYYDKACLKNFENNANVTALHFDDTTEIFIKELFDGSKNTQCKTDNDGERVSITGGHNCAIPWTVSSGDETIGQHISIDSEQLLPVDSSGRLFSESSILTETKSELTEECRQVRAE